ncbi:MAG: DUF5103 domain-containing protein [Bacteroidota bacterium]
MTSFLSLYIKFLFLSCLFINSYSLQAQVNNEIVLAKNIKTARLHIYGDQLAMPVYKLNSSDRLELHFDDMDGDVKSYYYTYQLCDYNWQAVNLSAFDYMKGFTQQRISNYRYSSIAYTRYTHYQAILPEANSVPTKSGNYLLKVFLNGDTSKLAFTKRLLVLDSKSAVAAQIMQPFTPQNFNTHQRIKFSVNISGLKIFNANQDIKVVVLQNNRWDNMQANVLPTFIRGNTLEYNTENSFVFPGGKEWRWLDLRSLRLLSERVDSADKKKNSTDIFVTTDVDRSAQRYLYYTDFNGQYQVMTYESINPYWQGDYARVHFKFAPPNYLPYKNKDVYLIGQLTDYQISDSTKLVYNPENGHYENSQFLKQGYYNYGYALIDRTNPADKKELDGDYWETENSYTILIYYKSFTDRNDQLIGVSKISSRTDRPGFSF